jgi:hypothetical protein
MNMTSQLIAGLFFLFAAANLSAAEAPVSKKACEQFVVDASAAPTAAETDYLQMGSNVAARSPTGHSISINSRYLTLDGKAWLPVMGEFHYSRYPAQYWEEEILKMKAGGVQIVSTYVFWIHHEEEENKFDWSGQRNLRHFIELCAKQGMYVWVRIGPWAHGEARNGGLPDWLLGKGPTRVNDAMYLSYTQRFYDQIGQQLKGLTWKDGGPIIGVQLENEYANRSANGGEAHIATLKGMAMKAGLDVPVYTVTGWDNAVVPEHIVTPVFGGYPDEPWAGSREEMPPDTQGVYQFAPSGGNAGILQGVASPSAPVQYEHYPRLTAELGAGLQLTYHRRVVISPDDIPPIAVTALGTGANLLGYYMYQGGINPEGALSTLQESQATGYPNDVPVKSYDFQAPLGAYGQVNKSFRRLKVVHQFIADFGSDLAPMTRMLPGVVPSGMSNVTTLRIAARTHGDKAYLFFNNYVRHYPMPEQKGVQVVLKLPAETITLPREPVDIPSQSAFWWPVNLDLNGAQLKYATAQPFAKLEDAAATYLFFTPSPGILTEFAFDAPTISSVTPGSGTMIRQDDRILVMGIVPSTKVAIEIRPRQGKAVRIVLLSREQAEDTWKVDIAGRERMLITRADVFDDRGTVHLRSRDPKAFHWSIFPDVMGAQTGSVPLQKSGPDGLFTQYRASVLPKEIQLGVEKVRDAAPPSPVKIGPFVNWRGVAVAEAPDDAAFAGAGVWHLTVPDGVPAGLSDVYLDINYVGDVGRLNSGARLLDDYFFNGMPWEIGLKRFPPHTLTKGLDLQILPLQKGAPIYLPMRVWPNFGAQQAIADVTSVRAIPEYEVLFAAPKLRSPQKNAYP